MKLNNLLSLFFAFHPISWGRGKYLLVWRTIRSTCRVISLEHLFFVAHQTPINLMNHIFSHFSNVSSFSFPTFFRYFNNFPALVANILVSSRSADKETFSCEEIKTKDARKESWTVRFDAAIKIDFFAYTISNKRWEQQAVNINFIRGNFIDRGCGNVDKLLVSVKEWK